MASLLAHLHGLLGPDFTFQVRDIALLSKVDPVLSAYLRELGGPPLTRDFVHEHDRRYPFSLVWLGRELQNLTTEPPVEHAGRRYRLVARDRSYGARSWCVEELTHHPAATT